MDRVGPLVVLEWNLESFEVLFDNLKGLLLNVEAKKLPDVVLRIIIVLLLVLIFVKTPPLAAVSTKLISDHFS